MSDFPNPSNSLKSLGSGLAGGEVASLASLEFDAVPVQSFLAAMSRANAPVGEFEMKVRVDADIEVEYIRNGGNLPYQFRDIIKAAKSLWPISLPKLSYFLAFRSYA